MSLNLLLRNSGRIRPTRLHGTDFYVTVPAGFTPRRMSSFKKR